MTSRQRRVLTMLTLAILAGLALILTAGCADEAVIPQDVVDGSWTHAPKQKETRPLFISCTHAQMAGVPLPLTIDAPGWNERLDADGNGLACE